MKKSVAIIVILVIGLSFLGDDAQAQPESYLPLSPLALLNSNDDEYGLFWDNEERVLYFTSDRSGKAKTYYSANDFLGAKSPSELPLTSIPLRGNYSYFRKTGRTTAILSAFAMNEYRPEMAMYSTVLNDTMWAVPVLLPGVGSSFFTAQGAVSPSGRLLAFVSDREGGQGGTDIWLSSRTANGGWEAPINIGAEINSKGNEISPFLASDDSLFFSSNGFGGKGGYEIFLSIRVGGVWQSPLPLMDFNSEYDDTDFIMTQEGDVFLCSNRPGSTGGLDIFFAPKRRKERIEQEVEYIVEPMSPFIAVEEFRTQDIIYVPVFLSLRAIHDLEEEGRTPTSSPATDVEQDDKWELASLFRQKNNEEPIEWQVEATFEKEDDSTAVAEALSKIRKWWAEERLQTEEVLSSVKKGSRSGVSIVPTGSRNLPLTVRKRGTMKLYSPDTISVFVSARPVEAAAGGHIELETAENFSITEPLNSFPAVVKVESPRLLGQKTTEIRASVLGQDKSKPLATAEIPVQYIEVAQKESQGIAEKQYNRVLFYVQPDEGLTLPPLIQRISAQQKVLSVEVFASTCAAADKIAVSLRAMISNRNITVPEAKVFCSALTPGDMVLVRLTLY